MVVVWVFKMRVKLCLLLTAVCVLADKNGNNNNRKTKPFIADAVGNTLPPPSNVPATVGSPISLLTPDRYEFYTFDESGELVKRLMTLEEIQAIVAAGEDSDGLVTFANDNQPTIAFNFSQPPYTKVHSVVTNVQNVLKAQMEAHKNNPLVQPTLDTPDVSDSWSLILPSIFGNSGVDIVPDKTASSFVPETDTIEESLNIDDNDNSLSKEGGTHILNSTTADANDDEIENILDDSIKTTLASSTLTTSTANPTTSTIKITTTSKPLSSTTIRKKFVTTVRPRTTTTKLPPTIKSTPTTTTTKLPSTIKSTTKLPPTTKSTTTTTVKPITTTSILRTTTTEPTTTTRKQGTTTSRTTGFVSNDIPTSIPIEEFEKISTFIPVSTVKYVTERSTKKPVEFTKAPFVYATTTKRSPSTTTKSPRPLSSTQVPKLQTTVTMASSTNKLFTTSTAHDLEAENVNLTTITTQSVSPSTTVSSTEFLSLENSRPDFEIKDDEPALPLFDVAQSISQIASDLGNNYQPIPTSSNLLDTTKVSGVDMESKENLDMDIPNDDPNNNNKNKNEDNFVKISTIDPHPPQKIKETDKNSDKKPETKVTTQTTSENLELTTIISNPSEGSTMDPFLSESMDDLLSQVVHEAPQPVLDSEKNAINDKKETTEKSIIDSTDPPLDNFSEISSSNDKTSTTQKTLMEPEKELPVKITPEAEALANKVENEVSMKTTTEKETTSKATTEKTTTVEKTTEKEVPVKVTTEKEAVVKETITVKASVKVTTEIPEPSKLTIENEKLITEIPVQITTEKETSDLEITEQNLPMEKEMTNVISSANNKISTDDKHNVKNEDSKDFVKISVSPMMNSSNVESNAQKDENVKFIEKEDVTVTLKETIGNENKTVIDSQQKLEIPTVDKVTNAPKEDVTLKPSKLSDGKNETLTSSQSTVNKISFGDKLSSTSKKDKIPEPLPKIEEFKKKIQKVNDEEMANDRNDPWKLIPTVVPPKSNDISKDKINPDRPFAPNSDDNKDVVFEFSKENQGLEVTTKDLEEDVAQFTELCNELAFRYWNTMVENIDKKRSFVLSPYSITSMLAMMFMGARGATSGEMNEILKLDDMVTFNPHFTLKNISDSIDQATNSGITVSAFVRELFSDKTKGKILTFYKERAQHFYAGHVEEINFKLIGDIIRRRTNLLVKKHTWGKIPEYMKTNSIVMKPPLAAFSANVFETDCTGTSVDGRDGEMYFVVSPNVRQRRLVPVPAVVYRSGFLAGYDPALDATAAALGNTNSIVSTIFLMPGQQGNIVHAEDLEKLEQRLLEASPTKPVWSRVLRTLLPRVGLELQIPRFSHKSVFNVSSTLRDMGLKDLFDPNHADLGGLNGPSKDLYLSDMIQLTSFVSCGEGMIGEQHHIEEYPETLSLARRRTSRWADWDEPRDYQRAFHDPHDVGEAMHLPLHLRPRQARLPTRSVQPARLKFDRPFLFFVRHNPTGMILYVGRYNPRLLP